MLFSVSEAADDGIHVDQVGYLTNHDKVAMVADAKDKTFEIIDTKTNKVVFTGKLSAPKYDAMSEETLSKADFTNLKTPGTYILKVGNRESYDFEIGDNVWLGDNVLVLPGVHIGKGCIIGASSVVTKDIPPYCVVAGIPAKVVKMISS